MPTEKRSAYWKEWYAKRRQDPEWVAKEQERQREYQRKRKLAKPDEVNRLWNEAEKRRREKDPTRAKKRSDSRVEQQREALKDPTKKRRFRVLQMRQRLAANFKLTLEQYDEMHRAQKGLCAACKKPEWVKQYGTVKRLSVDHCHATGKVRGLLCTRCNRTLGAVRDDPALLRALAEYLE